MSTPLPVSSPLPGAGTVLSQLWSKSLGNSPRGLVLAREKGWVLAWDDKDWLYLFNHAGERQGQRHADAPLAAACCADDGSAYVAAGMGGEIWWLAPDLMPRWKQTVSQRIVAAALDPFGHLLAVADARGNVHIFDHKGKALSQVQTPRPLHHLAFIPTLPLIVGSSDFGLVGCLDLMGRWLWRDGLVSHVGSLAVSGDGEQIVLACFSEGLQRYSHSGRNLGRLAVSEPYRLAALSFDGLFALVAGMGNRLLVLDHMGATRCLHLLARPAQAIALGALAESAVVALADGPLVCLDLKEDTKASKLKS